MIRLYDLSKVQYSVWLMQVSRLFLSGAILELGCHGGDLVDSARTLLCSEIRMLTVLTTRPEGVNMLSIKYYDGGAM